MCGLAKCPAAAFVSAQRKPWLAFLVGFWLAWLGFWLSGWLSGWFGLASGWFGLAFGLASGWLGLASGWFGLASGWFGLAPGWFGLAPGWCGLAPGWLSGWFGLALFFFPCFFSSPCRNAAAGHFASVSRGHYFAATRLHAALILRRTRSNAGRTSARSLSGRIESIWETPSKERASICAKALEPCVRIGVQVKSFEACKAWIPAKTFSRSLPGAYAMCQRLKALVGMREGKQ